MARSNMFQIGVRRSYLLLMFCSRPFAAAPPECNTIPTNIDPENCPIPISERLSTPELNGRVYVGGALVNALDGQFVHQMSVAELLNCNSCWFVSMGCSIIPLAIAYTTHCCDGSHLFKKVSILPLPEYSKPIAKPAFVQGLDIVSSIDWMIRSNLMAFITTQTWSGCNYIYIHTMCLISRAWLVTNSGLWLAGALRGERSDRPTGGVKARVFFVNWVFLKMGIPSNSIWMGKMNENDEWIYIEVQYLIFRETQLYNPSWKALVLRIQKLWGTLCSDKTNWSSMHMLFINVHHCSGWP